MLQYLCFSSHEYYLVWTFFFLLNYMSVFLFLYAADIHDTFTRILNSRILNDYNKDDR